MKIDKSEVKRMLVISLSNVGDIILTTPVIGALRKEFPSSRIDVMVGPNGKAIFEKDPAVFKLIIYDKHMPIAEKRRLQLKLKKLRYDIVIDLRNTIFPLLIGPKYRTATIERFPNGLKHKKARHLYRLKSLGIDRMEEPPYLYIAKEDESRVSELLGKEDIHKPIVVVNPGAKSHLKRWTIEGFSEVCDKLIAECNASVILTGLQEDADTVNNIMAKARVKPHNFLNKTNIRELASLIKRADILITNDSAPMHLGSAVGAKVLALFGPTDPRKFGPLGEFDGVINKKLFCSPCESAACRYNYECMKLISPDEVFDAAKMMIEGYE